MLSHVGFESTVESNVGTKVPYMCSQISWTAKFQKERDKLTFAHRYIMSW